MCQEESGDLNGIFCLCTHFPLISVGEGRVSQSPALGTAFLSSVSRLDTESVQVPQPRSLSELKQLYADTKL